MLHFLCIAGLAIHTASGGTAMVATEFFGVPGNFVATLDKSEAPLVTPTCTAEGCLMLIQGEITFESDPRGLSTETRTDGNGQGIGYVLRYNEKSDQYDGRRTLLVALTKVGADMVTGYLKVKFDDIWDVPLSVVIFAGTFTTTPTSHLSAQASSFPATCFAQDGCMIVFDSAVTIVPADLPSGLQAIPRPGGKEVLLKYDKTVGVSDDLQMITVPVTIQVPKTCSTELGGRWSQSGQNIPGRTSPKACQETCIQDPGCVQWSWSNALGKCEISSTQSSTVTISYEWERGECGSESGGTVRYVKLLFDDVWDALLAVLKFDGRGPRKIVLPTDLEIPEIDATCTNQRGCRIEFDRPVLFVSGEVSSDYVYPFPDNVGVYDGLIKYVDTVAASSLSFPDWVIISLILKLDDIWDLNVTVNKFAGSGPPIVASATDSDTPVVPVTCLSQGGCLIEFDRGVTFFKGDLPIGLTATPEPPESTTTFRLTYVNSERVYAIRALPVLVTSIVGTKTCTLIKNRQSSGSRLKTFPSVLTDEQCERECIRDPQCVEWDRYNGLCATYDIMSEGIHSMISNLGQCSGVQRYFQVTYDNVWDVELKVSSFDGKPDATVCSEFVGSQRIVPVSCEKKNGCSLSLAVNTKAKTITITRIDPSGGVPVTNAVSDPFTLQYDLTEGKYDGPRSVVYKFLVDGVYPRYVQVNFVDVWDIYPSLLIASPFVSLVPGSQRTPIGISGIAPVRVACTGQLECSPTKDFTDLFSGENNVFDVSEYDNVDDVRRSTTGYIYIRVKSGAKVTPQESPALVVFANGASTGIIYPVSLAALFTGLTSTSVSGQAVSAFGKSGEAVVTSTPNIEVGVNGVRARGVAPDEYQTASGIVYAALGSASVFVLCLGAIAAALASRATPKPPMSDFL